MKHCISTSIRSLMMGLILASFSTLHLDNVVGQEKREPAVIVALASINTQLKDIEYMASAASESIGQMSSLLRFQAQGFLTGIDFDKPAGALLYFEESSPEPIGVGFFPVKNLDDVLDNLANYAEIEEDDKIVTILLDNGEELSLVNKDGYAFISDNAEMLENLPTNAPSLIADQAKTYNLSAKVFPQQIPTSLRGQALDLIRSFLESTIDREDDSSKDQVELQMTQIESLINDFDLLTVGFDADQKGERILVDFKMKGTAGSSIEKRFQASAKGGPSQFAGFLMEKAAFSVNTARELQLRMPRRPFCRFATRAIRYWKK